MRLSLWSPSSVNLWDDLPSPQRRTQSPLRTLWAWYRGERGALLLAILFYIVKSSPIWAVPIFAANIISVITAPDRHSLGELLLNAGLTLALTVQNVPTHYLYMHYLSIASRDMETRLRATLSRRLQRLSMRFFDHYDSATLQTKVVRDVELIQQLTTQLFDMVPSAIFTILVALVVTAIQAPVFLLYYLVASPVAALVAFSLRNVMRRRNSQFHDEIEQVSTRVSEMIRLLPLTRAHGVEQDEIGRLMGRLEQARIAARRLDSTTAIFGSITWVTLRLFDALCLLVASLAVYTHALPLAVGQVVLLTGFSQALTNSLLMLASIAPQLSKGFASVSSLSDILDAEEVERNDGKLQLETVTGHFIFDHAGYAYPESGKAAVEDFNLTVRPGETVALVGHSGSGKTTLINLIIGFLQPTSGRILLDGRDMTTLDLTAYRHFIAVVAQETVLFHGTIRENILYGTPRVDEGRYQGALDDANVREFLDQLPDGDLTLLGENGARLSGGQRQRIAIARALIRQPRVLILDEATAALDTQSEALVQEALDRLKQGRTTFVVAHRLSTVRAADRIVVLDHGRIAEIGSHDELLAREGVYAHLHDLATA